METKKVKQLPYGESDFGSLITNNYAYVDKTRFIEMMEREPNRNHFFIRPRKFGKSLFFSMLSYYYDINRRDEFDAIFGNLYIGRNPTPEHNRYAMLKFNFSGIDTLSVEDFKKSFNRAVQDSVCTFLGAYKSIIPGYEALVADIKANNLGISALGSLFGEAENNNVQIYVIIDGYDHFANDLIAMGGNKGDGFYKAVVRTNGLVRDFYERLKDGSSTVIHRTFITGISPVMLDDLTSGYNIAEILTLNPYYNEMMGFTQEEVDWLMQETSVNPELVNVDMEKYYNGYKFHQEAANRMYNPAMVLYFFSQIIRFKKPPVDIIDLNLKTDYGRLQKLVQNENNRTTLMNILKEGGIVANVLPKFSIDMIYDDGYFVSLLFYMGLLTIKDEFMLQTRLQIPNYSIRTLYWEYLDKQTRVNSPLMTVQSAQLNQSILTLALTGEIEPFISYVSGHAFSKLSDFDLQQFDEKYIKILLLAYLFMSNIYEPMSEYEAVPGRADIYLYGKPQLRDKIKYEWLFEIKYCKASAKPAEIETKKKQGLEQLEEYLTSHRLKDRPDLRAALLIFIGKNKYEIIEKS
jgi:hypothetical protein